MQMSVAQRPSTGNLIEGWQWSAKLLSRARGVICADHLERDLGCGCTARPHQVGREARDRLCDADQQLGSHGSGFVSYRWYYMRQGTGAPVVGGTPSGGSLSPAEADSSYARASLAGESVSRGGFGDSAGHSGGAGDAGE
jgi:hypothetical protein